MILTLEREPTVDGTTIGMLSVNGVFCCFTLEDAVREGPKIAHETAIPAGSYPVTMYRSPRFQRMVPRVNDVHGFSDIEIHSGNTKEDTSGCILVGLAKNLSRPEINSSRAALDMLQPEIARALAAGEPVTLDIVNAPADGLKRA